MVGSNEIRYCRNEMKSALCSASYSEKKYVCKFTKRFSYIKFDKSVVVSTAEVVVIAPNTLMYSAFFPFL